jgi:8-oxo-dGTP diphosphatase
MAQSIAGIALDDKTRVFIARRLPGGDLGGKWEFPGGKVEENESPEEALKREFDEEFGIPVRVGSFLAETSFVHHGKVFSLKAYRIYFENESFVLREHSEWKWAPFPEIGKLDFAESDLKLLPLLLKSIFC